MTVLGKILAILNLILSVAVGAFIVMTYVVRTDWHRAYVEVDKQVKGAQANAQAYQQEGLQVRGELNRANDKLLAMDKTLKDNEVAADARLKQEIDRHNQEIEKAKTFSVASSASAAELERRQQEVAYLTSQLRVRDDQLKNMEKVVEDTRNRAVESEIAAKSEQNRNNNLLDQLEKLTKDVQKAQQAGSTALVSSSGPRRNPPAENVEGLVKKTDPASGLVTLTIGSDAGLAKGNTLEVYRLRPEPAYLGTLEILQVRPDEAVAKPQARLRGQIKVGDQVSSNILSSRS
jgi:hypothetical protein